MSKLAFILQGKVHEIIPKFDPVFPNIPVEQRYSPDFLSKCVMVDDTVDVGYIQTENGFEPPIQEETEVIE